MTPASAGPDSTTQATTLAVHSELERITSSPQFCKAERMVRLLRFVVEETLAGRSATLKEYSLGVSVFDRPAGYEPKADPVVRLEVRRLRFKLAEYYQTRPDSGPPLIEIPKGTYVPVFRCRSPKPEEAPEVSPGEAPPDQSQLPPRERPLWRRWVIWTAAIVIVSLTAVLFVLVRPRWSLAARLEPGVEGVRRSVAVVGVQELAGPSETGRSKTGWLGTAISEMLNSELQLGLRLRATPQNEVSRMLRELGGPISPRSPQQLQQVRRNLAVDMVVTGSYAVADGQLRLDLQAVDTRSGEVLSAVSESGDQARLFDLVGRAGARMRTELGAATPDSDARSSRLFPASPGAMELYAKALDKLRAMDAPAARDLLQQASAADPSNPLVLAALAGAWSTLGYDTRARKAAEQALSLTRNLPPSDGREIGAKCHAVLHQWDAAIEIYSNLLRDYPDDVESGLMLVAAQNNAGRIWDALRTIGLLRRLPQLSGDPRLDLAEARTAFAAPDFPRIAKLAASAAEKAKATGARFAYARARLLQAGALQSMASGNFAELRQEARAVCRELGDKACVAATLRIEGNYQVLSGSIAQGRETFREALQLSREIGSVGEEIQVLNGLAYAARQQGDLDAAGEAAGEALRLSRETEQKPATMSMLLGVAEVAEDRGDLVQAAALTRESLSLGREIGNVEGCAEALAVLARLAERRGDVAEARREYDEAEQTLRRIESPPELADVLAARAELQIEQGELAAAERSLADARTLRAKAGDSFTADTTLSFARLALAKGRPAEAESLSRQAESRFRSGQRTCAQAEAIITLARSLLAQKRNREAAGESARAAGIASHTRVGRLLAEANLIRERALVLAGHVPQRDELLQVQRDAAGAADARLTLEASLLGAEVAALHHPTTPP